MNANLRSNKNINFFLPDPWNFSQKSYPRYLDSFLAFPKYFAQNYKSLKISKILFFGLLFFKSIIRLKLFNKFLFEFPTLILNIIIYRKPTLTFYLFLDLMLLELAYKSSKNKVDNLSIIFVNSVAHFQHNYWDEKKTYKLFFYYFDKMNKVINKIKKNYSNFLIANGLSQIKIRPKYICKLSNPEFFFEQNNIDFKSIEPNMTTGGTIFFNNNLEKTNCYNFLSKFKYGDQSIFFIRKYKFEKKLYFRLDAILSNNLNFINKKNLNNVKINNHVLKEQLIDQFNNLLYYLSLIKSTSIHSSKGEFYHSKFVKCNSLIQNQEIYNFISEYFKLDP